ncbi:response regulator [Candidatus Roizmanbacteria bacterium]|nr:response regulator [Candidatus Roizmanbacteria bacterium]
MKKILVVEDDNFLANAYRVKLNKAGFEVKNAYDGIEALSVLRTYIPDLILLDIVMPKKDGFATLEEIKKQDQLKNIPVILASNLGQKEDMDRGLKLGAIEFFVKTEFSLNNLIEKINKILNTSPSSSA